MTATLVGCCKEEIDNTPVESIVNCNLEPDGYNRLRNTSYNHINFKPFFNYYTNTPFDSDTHTLFAADLKDNGTNRTTFKVISNHLDELKGYVQITDLNNNELYSFVSPQNFTREILVQDYDNNGYEDVFLVGSGIDTFPYSGDSNFIVYMSKEGYELVQIDPEVGCFHGAASGDINNDGYADIIPIRRNVGNGASYIYYNNGDRTFTKVPLGNWDLFQQTLQYELYDINNDGYLDLFLGGQDYEKEDENLPYRNRVVFGSKDGIDMNNSIDLPTLSEYGTITNIDFYDIDSDGTSEVYITRAGSLTSNYYRGVVIEVLTYNGDFKRDKIIKGPVELEQWAYNSLFTDVDGDCLIDIVPWSPYINDNKRNNPYVYDNSNGFYFRGKENGEFINTYRVN